LKDFRWLYVVYPLITASITSVVHPLRRYALIQSNEPLFFAARHVVHFTGRAVIEPFPKLSGVGWGSAFRDAA